jgi:hypothetical protein
MRGMTRGAATLIGVAVAGFLLWFGASALPTDGDASIGEFWWAVGLIAAAGLVMALSQLLGGWTKWGRPHLSRNVFLLGFLPALIAGGWVVLAAEPADHWLGSHVRDWSNDIGLESLVGDLLKVWPALAFGVGLTLGLSFDTAPRVKEPETRPVETSPAEPQPDVSDREPDRQPVPVGDRTSAGETPEPEATTGVTQRRE